MSVCHSDIALAPSIEGLSRRTGRDIGSEACRPCPTERGGSYRAASFPVTYKPPCECATSSRPTGCPACWDRDVDTISFCPTATAAWPAC